MYQPILEGNYIYFIDISEGYRLCRYSLSNETIEVITNDRIDAYNIIGTSIYYQKNSTEAPAFKRISIDGSNELILLEGNYTNINATSNYVYFQPFHDLGITYKVPTSGSPIISEFTAAIPNY